MLLFDSRMFPEYRKIKKEMDNYLVIVIHLIILIKQISY